MDRADVSKPPSALRSLADKRARFREPALEARRGELQAVGPGERTPFDEGAAEVGGVGEGPGQLRVPGDQRGGRPEAVRAVAEAQRQLGVAGRIDAGELIIGVGSRDHLHRQQHLATHPVCHERLPMVQRPLANDARGLARQLAVEDLAVLDPDEGFDALAGGVEVRRRRAPGLRNDRWATPKIRMRAGIRGAQEHWAARRSAHKNVYCPGFPVL